MTTTTQQRQKLKEEPTRRLAPTPSTTTPTTLTTQLEDEVHTSQSTIPEPQYSFPVITLESEPNLPDDYLPEGLSNKGDYLQPPTENSKVRRSVYTAEHADYGKVVVKEIKYHSNGIHTDDEVKRQEIIAERYKKYNERINTQLQVYNEIGHIGQTPETLMVIKKGFRTYIVQEKLNIPTVQDYVKENGPLTPEQAVRVMQSVAIPLSKVHDQGTIHRDISPGNIFIDPEALDEGAIENIAIVNDFDDAVVDDLFTDDNFYTTTMGTPGFASIEVAEADVENYGPWSDNRSLAAVAAYMLVGHNRLTSGFRLKDSLLTNVPREIVDVLKQNINPVQSERHASVLEMVRVMAGISEADAIYNILTENDEQSGSIPKGIASVSDTGNIRAIAGEKNVNWPVAEKLFDLETTETDQSPSETENPHIIPDFYEEFSDLYENELKEMLSARLPISCFRYCLANQRKVDDIIKNPYEITIPSAIKDLGKWTRLLREPLEKKGLTPENIKARNRHEKMLRKSLKKGLKDLRKKSNNYSGAVIEDYSNYTQTILEELGEERVSILNLKRESEHTTLLWEMLESGPTKRVLLMTEETAQAYEKLPLTTDTVDFMKKHIGNYVEHLEKLKEKSKRKDNKPELFEKDPNTGREVRFNKRPTLTDTYNVTYDEKISGLGNALLTLFSYPGFQAEYGVRKIARAYYTRKQRRLASPKNIETEVIEAELVDDVLTENEKNKFDHNGLEKVSLAVGTSGLIAGTIASYVSQNPETIIYMSGLCTTATGMFLYGAIPQTIKYKRKVDLVLDKGSNYLKKEIDKIMHPKPKVRRPPPKG